MQQRCARPCQAGLAARDASLCLFKTSRGAPRRPRAVADSAYRDTLNSSGPVSAADAEPCSSGRSAAQCTLPSVLAARLRLPSVCSTSVVLGLGLGHQLLLPLLGSAHAAETISGSGVELFRQFLEQIDSLGPWGGVLFVVTVMAAEMVPLFPTQPLSLASGLLFGPKKGALLMLVGVTGAAFNAFMLARGVGRPLAERIIAAEMKHGSKDEAGSSSSSSSSSSSREGPGGPLGSVTRAIEEGGFVRQLTAVTLLRLTPVVPYSASNYLLGLTPLPLGPYLLGTVAGMTVWASLYASLGGASRALLRQGVDLEVLLADMAAQASRYTKDVAVLGVAAVAVAGMVLALRRQGAGDTPQAAPGPLPSHPLPEAPSPSSPAAVDSVEEALSRK